MTPRGLEPLAGEEQLVALRVKMVINIILQLLVVLPLLP